MTIELTPEEVDILLPLLKAQLPHYKYLIDRNEEFGTIRLNAEKITSVLKSVISKLK